MRALRLSASWEPSAGTAPSERETRERRARSGSAVWRDPRLAVVDVPEPSLRGDTVLIQVACCGICGSDLLMSEADDKGYIRYPGLTRFPGILGHEFSGVVVAVGADVRSVRPGDLVTAEEMHWCGVCALCRRGYLNHCEALEELGFTVPGAMAEYVAVAERYCWPLGAVAERMGDATEALRAGALVEPIAVTYHALFIRNERFKPGQYGLVFGAGPIGLAAVGLLAAAGSALIVSVEPAPSRRRLALSAGADHALAPEEVSDEALLALTGGRGFDVVVEGAGAPHATIARLERGLAVDAAICQIGWSSGRTPLPLETYQVRRVQLYGAQGHSGYGVFPNVIRLIASGRLDLRPIISADVALADAVAAFDRLRRREDAKILVHPAGRPS